MNALTPVPAPAQLPKKPAKRLTSTRSDQEFLAPALEILETPASPVRMAFLIIICALTAVTITWAYLGHVDIIAIANGKIEPTGKVKIIQPLQTGKVAQILAQNGDHVQTGQVLVELEAADAQSQLNDLVQQAAAIDAEIARRRTAITLIKNTDARDTDILTATVAWDAAIPEPIRQRESGVLEKDLMQLSAELASIDAQLEQKAVHERSIASTIVAQRSLNATLRDLSSMQETLASREAVSKAEWLRSLETLKAQEVTLSTELAQQADDAAAMAVLRGEAAKIRGRFLAAYMQSLAETEQRADDIGHKIDQARSRLEQFTLHSPIDGVVQGSSLTTLGQVVTTGQELMRVVPVAKAVDIEAYLPNQDIGFVRVGQEATVKIAAFPFTQYGTVKGKIIRVGRDAVSSGAAAQAMMDPSRAGATADVAQGLLFPILVELDAKSIVVDGAAIDLMPGMAVTVEINTGSRRILEYLFSPMVEVTSTAMRER